MNDTNEFFIIFTSKYSNSCKKISEQVNHIFPYYNTKVIDVDNPVIRKAILNATTNKIKTVPSIMLFRPQQNAIKIYEGDEVFGVLDQAVQMVNEKIAGEQQQQQDKMAAARQAAAELASQQEEQAPQPQLRQRRRQQTEEFSPLDDVLNDEEDSPPPPPKNNRRKIQKGVYASTEFSPIDEESHMITTLKPLPPKGEGHTGMARSTLPEYADNEEAAMRQKPRGPMGPDFEGSDDIDVDMPPSRPPVKKVQMKTGKKVQFIEDLSDVPIDDVSYDEPPKPTGMSLSDILGEGGGMNIPMESKETSIKSSAVKNAAEALMRQRQQQESHLPQHMR
jgi:hypothetical protein